MAINWRYEDGKRQFPEGFFGPPEERGEDWPDDPELRAAINWFIELMGQDEWMARRAKVAEYFHSTAEEKVAADSSGRYFDSSDRFAWYLFQAEALLDHMWNYEPMYGSRVVPILKAIGRRLDHLKSIPHADERARRTFTSERSQPNGGLFELLVASKYAEIGAQVEFKPERPGVARTHDLDVEYGGQSFAVECKRMDDGQYAEAERARARELWLPTAHRFVSGGKSAFCNVNFTVPLADVPDDYLAAKATDWIASGQDNLLWRDEVAWGSIGEPYLGDLQAVLEDYEVLVDSTRFHELVLGKYVRNANIIQSVRMKAGMSPRHVAECDLAIMMRWSNQADESIERKARDITRHLAKANDQFPNDVDAIVHIGFEAVDRDEVEVRRKQKIFDTVNGFDSGRKRLARVYCHWFSPESAPGDAWGFDETVNWLDLMPEVVRHLPGHLSLVLPDEAETRVGAHWEG